ncbi:TonB-dependent receptor [Archangium lipolyticum]|uniref:TonB-dependent receptor n=1 Tax=Archangium lipolyticum TaxID=2970465 RepID=UPI002DD6A66B|nr:TonB-dependent receptor [Archangium lipolyticum]
MLSLRLHSIRAALAALALLAAPVMAQTPVEGTAPAAAPTEAAAPAEPTAPVEAPAPAEDPHPSPLPEGEGAADMGTEDEMMADSATPPPGFTGVYGQVSDAQTKETLIEATVKVVTGAQKSVLTDVDGNYQLALPPGKYDLRVFYDVYEGRRITGVIVEEGKATKLDVQLSADAGAVQEVVVEARADRRAEGALLQERKKAAAVSDAISSQEMARTPDSSASDAVKRVVSATVVGGRYVLLRGLGGRYSTTLLNGAILPSPEPDEQAVPLDIFPTSLLANLNILKSYTADLPGTFAGGVLLIETNNYPSQFEFKPRINFSGDTASTFRNRFTYNGGGLNWLGFDDGTRKLPDSVPRTGPLLPGQNGMTVEDVNRVGRDFPNIWTLETARALPNMGIGASIGDTLRFDNKRLGYLAMVNYGHKESVQLTDVTGTQAAQGGGVTIEDTSRNVLGTESASISGLVSAGFQPSRDFELSVFSLFTRTGESRARSIAGADAQGQQFSKTASEFTSRALTFNQLRGFHRLNVLGDMEVDWQANYSYVDRSEPDTRSLPYGYTEEGTPRYNNDPGAERWYSELGESSFGGSANATLPLSGVRLRVGGMAQGSMRALDMRRFRYQYVGGNLPVLNQGPEDIFASDNIGNGIRVLENTLSDDAYDATLGLFAGYATADVSLWEPLRLVAGLRYEASVQRLTSGSDFGGRAQSKEANQDYKDFLPTLNVIYALNPQLNLRAGYSYTLARPTFRELAPVLYYDFVRNRSVSGDPSLVQTRIHNLDARAEWFPGENDVLAASVFYKRFQQPIERIIVSSFQQDVSFDNAPGATSYGVELEARTSLGRLTPTLAPLRVGANLTLTRSEIDLGDSAPLQTNQQRPLQGQSPYVVNLNLGYARTESGTEISLLYNVVGARISEVGIEGLPDVYEQPFHRVDLTVGQKLSDSLQLKLAATNILNQPVVFRQGDVDVLKYRPGVAFSASLGWSL